MATELYPNATHFLQISGDSVPTKASADYLPASLDAVFQGRPCLGITQEGDDEGFDKGSWALGSQWKLLYREDVVRVLQADIEFYKRWSADWADRVDGHACLSVSDEWIIHTMVREPCPVPSCSRTVLRARLFQDAGDLAGLLATARADTSTLALRKVGRQVDLAAAWDLAGQMQHNSVDRPRGHD